MFQITNSHKHDLLILQEELIFAVQVKVEQKIEEYLKGEGQRNMNFISSLEEEIENYNEEIMNINNQLVLI